MCVWLWVFCTKPGSSSQKTRFESHSLGHWLVPEPMPRTRMSPSPSLMQCQLAKSDDMVFARPAKSNSVSRGGRSLSIARPLYCQEHGEKTRGVMSLPTVKHPDPHGFDQTSNRHPSAFRFHKVISSRSANVSACSEMRWETLYLER